MLRLTKTQKEIEELAKRVPKLTDKQKEWAIKNYVYTIGILGTAERECVCPNCHGTLCIPDSKTDETRNCPHCGAKVGIRRFYDSRCLKWTANGVLKDYHKEKFFQVMSVVGDWQVTRLFLMERWCYVRKNNTPWVFYEVCQAWNNPIVRTTHFRSLPKKCLMGYNWGAYNPYSLHRWRYECTNPDNESYCKYIAEDNELEPRMVGGANYFDVNNLAPNARILPSYKQCGLTAEAFRKIKNIGAMALMEGVSRCAFSTIEETLLKCGGYEVFDKMRERTCGEPIDKQAYFTAWKICQRNGYNYKQDATEWLDLVGMLIDLGMDFHSPHYVCPANLHEMHQRILRQKARRDEIRELEKNAGANAKLQKRIAKYLDMDIHNKDLKIIVLPSISAFKAEGDHLGHCVYSGAYYNRENSLILSARGKKNKRWETIEVSLRTFTILQCYGYGDTFTERHSEIIDLVMENMWQIKERALGKKKRKERKLQYAQAS